MFLALSQFPPTIQTHAAYIGELNTLNSLKASVCLCVDPEMDRPFIQDDLRHLWPNILK